MDWYHKINIRQKFKEAQENLYNIDVYDNQGKSWDRFTVIIDDAVYGMSSNPQSPQGFNQYCCTKNDVDLSSLGIKRKHIPIEIQEAILERLEVE